MMKKLALAVALTALTTLGCSTAEEQTSPNTSTVTTVKETAEKKVSNNQRVTFANGSLEIEFPKGWSENEKENPFDIQYFDNRQRMNTGVFLYKSEDLAADATPQGTLEFHINDLQSKREKFTILEPEQTESLEGKKLTTAIYSGERNASKNYYKFTLVEFDEDPDQYLVILQVALPSTWRTSKPTLEEITRSAQLNAS